MERYGAIANVSFGQIPLPLPISASLSRRAEPKPACRDSDAFISSVQLDRRAIGVEVRIGDTAAAENLSLGQTDVLSIELLPTRSGQTGRKLSIGNAVLTGIELQYQQTAPATAKLNFLAEATDGTNDPFAAQEA
jgi:hypothetical protein